MFFGLIAESLTMAFKELTSNKLRTFLSLAGITIGIFCIISVLTVIDSFEDKIKNTFTRLGSDVVYIDKFPWTFDENQDWSKIVKRPDPSIEDYEAIKAKVTTARAVSCAFDIIAKEVKFKNNSLNDIAVFAPTHEFDDIWQLTFTEGRYFSQTESHNGSDVAIIGATIAEELFPNGSAIGRDFKFDGRIATVIGVLEKEGESIMGTGFDDRLLIPINFLRKFTSSNSLSFDPMVNVAPVEGVSLERLKSDVRQALRASRRLRPSEEDNFSINQLSMITSLIDQLFSVVNLAGWLIGGFSILVGGFGIANIMFVSVRERTKIIGIKKSLGAKQSTILLEFIIEAIMLCLIGGFWGLLSVFLMMKGIEFMNADYAFGLNSANIFLGVVLSILIGMLAGFVPALMAARMNPVNAIRGT